MTRPSALFAVDETGQWSGGGRVFLENARYAASRHDVLRGDSAAVPLIPRNVPTRRRVTRPYVLAPQNAWPWNPRTSSARERASVLALRVASEWYLRRAGGVLRISSAIPAIGPRHGVSPILHNVLDKGFDAAQTADAAPPAGARDAFVSVGSANSYRGFESLIQAHDLYRRSGGDKPLFVAGPPTNAQYVRRLRELVGDRPDVTLRWESLDRATCLAAYRSAFAVVLPSEVEASPLSLLEALAVTPRVLCSDIPGHREIVRSPLDPRCYFAPADVQGLAARLEDAESIASGHAHALLFDAEYRAGERRRWAGSLAAWLTELSVDFGEHWGSGV